MAQPHSQQNRWTSTGVDIRDDAITRQLYATDASIYEILPKAVAFPKGPDEISRVLVAAADAKLPVTPRGSGSGLAGGAIGKGLIMDCQRFNQQIHSFDPDQRSIRVGPGVVLDALNAFLRPHGFQFGPDVATSSRATLGGMIANNSSGARVTAYGVTGDHVRSLDLIKSDGSRMSIDNHGNQKPKPFDDLLSDIQSRAPLIREKFPDGMIKRWHGYGLKKLLDQPSHWTQLLSGSEGTLAVIAEAELNIVPLPKEKGLGLLFFNSITDAMQASVGVADLKPIAIEHIDSILFDQTRGQLLFQQARDLLQLDTQPCESILMVEFQEDVTDRLTQLEKRNLGMRHLMLKDSKSMQLVWQLRKAGLSLLTGCKGVAKPTTGIEDAAVRPEILPEYVQELQKILTAQKLEACYYGHAASGLLHIRPVLNIQKPGDVQRFRTVADDVSKLVKTFKGSLAAEHGVGMARTEYLEDHIGSELMDLHRKIKETFDPHWRLNPGKVIEGNQKFRIDSSLRRPIESGSPSSTFSPELAFSAKDSHWTDNLAQCNGCGGCRKPTATMCPTFLATGEEIMSTRGRANLIRSWTQDGREKDEVLSMLQEALRHCLSCKACKTECPSNVDMALIKAELQQVLRDRKGVSLSQWLFGHVDWIAEWASHFPALSNRMQSWNWLRKRLEKPFNLSTKRPLPDFADQRFDLWFAQRTSNRPTPNGPVYLWDDTFARHYDPHIGKAAVEVLEHLGFEVRLLLGRQCCGRPSFSQGDLRRARRLGQHNIDLIERNPKAPILFLEPSCFSMFREDYTELGVKGADSIAKRSHLLEAFLAQQCEKHPEWRDRFHPPKTPVTTHVHCHAKALTNTAYIQHLKQHLWPDIESELLKSGCCGMAGAFGASESEYELSVQVGNQLAGMLNQYPENAQVISNGTSCRHQIEHLTDRKPQHIAELLAETIRKP